MLTADQGVPNDLEAFWMPFTSNRHFKTQPRLIARAAGMHYTLTDGRQVLDATAGLWCCNAGHANPRIVEAIRQQAAELDFAPSFQWGHPKAFELASQLAHLFPGDLDHAFFTNSGSESVDTALKYAFVGRRNKKRDFRRLWVVRINAAARENGLTYSQLINGLKHAGNTLDRKSLAELAATSPAAFAAVAAQAKSALAARA